MPLQAMAALQGPVALCCTPDKYGASSFASRPAISSCKLSALAPGDQADVPRASCLCCLHHHQLLKPRQRLWPRLPTPTPPPPTGPPGFSQSSLIMLDQPLLADADPGPVLAGTRGRGLQGPGPVDPHGHHVHSGQRLVLLGPHHRRVCQADLGRGALRGPQRCLASPACVSVSVSVRVCLCVCVYVSGQILLAGLRQRGLSARCRHGN